ncbi:MAG TPA: AgmX/PglI C-terminal domain-containing protein [Polyangiaceae bacterium]|nr:AgmX/PglI C-terminal domain-containing protein [Polyangiaceae bacterium]
MRAAIPLLLAVSCGGARPAETAPSAIPTSTPAPTSTPTPPPPAAAPTPTGGIVIVGDIAAAKKFDPRRTLDASAPSLLDCYNQVRATQPALSGKLTLLIAINESGAVLKVDPQPGGSANVPELVACIESVLKATPFPKPGGMATVIAPLLFRP